MVVAEAVAAETGFTQFGILGPLEVSRAGRAVPLGGPRQRAVLAVLLLEANRVVSMDRLAEDVWAGHPPPEWVTTLRTYVSHLRQALEPGRAAGAAGEVLVTRDRGYLLRVDREHLDAALFEEGFTAGRAMLDAGRYAEAAQALREALDLWRGQVLANLADYPFTRPEAARLAELRLAAVEARIDADLALGRHNALTGELDGLVRDHPLRERLHAQLMLALYRCGRQAEALAAYRRARALLADELGLEPGEELRALEQAVLRHHVPPAAPEQPQHNLPARLTSFVGREDELAGVGKLVGQGPLVTLTGAGGAGKTRLAVEFAATVVGRFPDGVWLAELAGVSDPGLVGAKVMEALEVRQTSAVPVLEALRCRLRSANLLLVLDNCEHLLDACAGLVAALLADAPGLRVLATSREALGVPGEAVYVVPPLAVPAGDVGPAVIAAAPAVRLFADRVSSARADAEVLAASAASAGRICQELDGLPLAIELAAARASVLSVEEIESHLTNKFRFLAYRRPTADPRHQALKTAIDWSFDLLSAAEQRVLAQLSVFAGGFALTQAAQVCTGGDRAAALDMVDRLVAKSLMIARTAGSRTRYRILETIRQYAAGRLAGAGETQLIRRRHAEAFLELAEREQDLAVLSGEQDNFRAALDWALSQRGDTGPRLARALGGFWLARGLALEGQGWLERALATGPADPWLRAELLRLFGTVLHGSDLVQAESVLSEGSRVAEEAGLLAVQARIRVVLGSVREMLGRPDANAFEECQEMVAALESEGDLAGLAEAWIRMGNIRAHVHGDILAAVEACDRAAAYARASGNHVAEEDAQFMLGWAYQVGPIPVDVAISRTEQFLDQASGDPWAEAPGWQTLSGLYALAGRFADARAAIGRVQSAHTRSGEKIWLAVSTAIAGEIELGAGDPAAAEQQLRKACEELRAIGERGFLASALPSLAEAVYAQGRLDEACQLTEDAETLADPDNITAQAVWRATRAKILARRGQHAAAGQLADQAQALAAPTSVTALLAEVLEAKAEVSRLAGATAQAETCLRTALDIHEQRRASALADRTRAALASLLAQPG